MAEQEKTRLFRRTRAADGSAPTPLCDNSMPGLFGSRPRSYKIKAESVLASFITHIALLVLLIWLVRVVAPGPRVLDAARNAPVVIIDPVLHLGHDSTGTGGERSPLAPTAGTPPPTSVLQIVMPTAHPPETAELPVQQTVNSLTQMLQSQMIGNPLSKLMTLANGPGTGGIGNGPGGGVGNQPGSGAGQEPRTLHAGMIAPRGIYTPDPEFSEEARKKKHQGVVKLEVVIGVDGRVHDPRVVQSLGLGLDEKALEKISGWRFEPARTSDGRQIPVRASIEVHFNLL